jgi:hypothetical protein
MNSIDIFTPALGLTEPWHVTKVEFVADPESTKGLHLWVDFTHG